MRRILYLSFWRGHVGRVIPGDSRRTTHSGAPHLLDASLRCSRWIRQKVLDGRTVSRALARKHAARVSTSTFVPRVVSNAIRSHSRSLIVSNRLLTETRSKNYFSRYGERSYREKRRFSQIR